MDYTKVPRALIYRDKKNLDDFIEANELNAALIKNMADIEDLLNSDFEQYALTCMNVAYYICTIFMLEKHPVWRLSTIDSYICRLNLHPVEEYKKIIFSIVYLMLKHYNKNWQDNNRDLLEKIYVCIYPEFKNVRVRLQVSIEGSPKDIMETLNTKLPANFVLPDDEFAPRIIDKEAVHDALATEGFSWVKFVNYFEERSVRDIVKTFGRTEEEKHNVVGMLRQASHGFYTAGFNDYPEKVDKMLDDIDKELSCKYTLEATQATSETEVVEKKKHDVDLTPYKARIKELEEENERLSKENEELKEIKMIMDTPLDGIEADSKVGLTLIMKLMKNDGADFEKSKNKTVAAKALKMMTGRSESACKQIFSVPLSPTYSGHKKKITELNDYLKKLGMKTQL